VLLSAWLPALAYLLASTQRSLHPQIRMGLADGDSAPLPPGLEKQVLRSPLPTAQQCHEGDIALVHFTVSLADGKVVHDSRNSEPLEFRVGLQPSEVVSHAAPLDSHRTRGRAHRPAVDSQALGWDLALPGMRVGEVARLRCAPEFAYGERGAPPLIPPAATLTFDVELLRLRDLMSSHVPEEIDAAAQYREILASEERTRQAEVRAREPPPAADEDGPASAPAPMATGSAAPVEAVATEAYGLVCGIGGAAEAEADAVVEAAAVEPAGYGGGPRG
jgi:FKBP-type peptidyl-prolyl cis-trans isomerases 1